MGLYLCVTIACKMILCWATLPFPHIRAENGGCECQGCGSLCACLVVKGERKGDSSVLLATHKLSAKKGQPIQDGGKEVLSSPTLLGIPFLTLNRLSTAHVHYCPFGLAWRFQLLHRPATAEPTAQDGKDFGCGCPCDGPGHAGTCGISAWDAFCLAVFWMLICGKNMEPGT